MMIAQNAAAQEGITFVGIDVGKFACVAVVHGRAGVTRFAPDEAGCARFLEHLRDLPGAVRVGMEATGGCEWALWELLEAAGFHVRQLAPAKVSAYARSVGRRAKTDDCDAVTIAGYMAANPLAGRRIPSANVREIKALATRRRQVVEMRATLSCQGQHVRHALVLAQDKALAALLDAQIAELECAIRKVIAGDADLAEKHRLLRGIQGIGAVSAFTLLGEMPELGTLTSGAAAALAGLAPFARDSGTTNGHRFIQGGRSPVRAALYMAAVRASADPKSHKPFADRLRAAGKPGKKIVIAIARKLVESANLVLKRRADWEITAV